MTNTKYLNSLIKRLILAQGEFIMNLTEKVAYLQGLAEGLDLDTNDKANKLLVGMLDLLSDISEEVTDMGDAVIELSEQIDAVDEDLADVEEFLIEEDEDDCGCDDCDDCEFYEVVCPSCGEEICIDEELLEEAGCICPSCGEELEFDFDCECGEDCDCEE